MAVQIKTLVTIAPFNEEARSQILAKLDSLNGAQKMELTRLCWAGLASYFESKLNQKMSEATIAIAQGKAKYTPDDLKKIETDLYKEFSDLLSTVETKVEVQEVREELQKYINKPQPAAKNPNTTETIK